MSTAEVLVDAYGRVRDLVRRALDGADEETLTFRVDRDANTVAWLVWHLSRIQDDHLAVIDGVEQLWTAGGFYERFNLPFDHSATGFGHSSADVAAVHHVPADALLAYHEAVAERTIAFVARVEEDDLARVVDTSYTPPVTMAVRLVSVLSDNLQHAGQALFVRGVASRRG